MSLNTKEKLEEKTKVELIEYADSALGLNLKPAQSKEEMIEIILHNSQGVDQVADIVSKEDTQAVLKGRKGKGPGRGKIRIMIARSAEDKKQRPVFIGHNGVGYLIPRGKEVDLPAKVMPALYDAVELQQSWDDEVQSATGLGALVMREGQSYPFSCIAFGEEDEKGYVGKAATAMGYDL